MDNLRKTIMKKMNSNKNIVSDAKHMTNLRISSSWKSRLDELHIQVAKRRTWLRGRTLRGIMSHSRRNNRGDKSSNPPLPVEETDSIVHLLMQDSLREWVTKTTRIKMTMKRWSKSHLALAAAKFMTKRLIHSTRCSRTFATRVVECLKMKMMRWLELTPQASRS